jgi:predicted nucleotidyltransferase
MIDEETIQKAASILAEAAPGSKVILFGSYARGTAGEDSDVDLLVVEPEVRKWRSEMVRLLETLRPLRIPVDVLVVSRATFDDWADEPDTVLYEAHHAGRVLREGF